MPVQVLIRGGVALACACAVVASLIARDSRLDEQDAVKRLFVTGDIPRAVERLEDARRLNPDYAIDIGLARLLPARSVPILRAAIRREPYNGELWLRLAQRQVVAGDRAGARRSYSRARELAPRLPPGGPPPDR